MDYKGSFRDIIYARPDRTPAVLRYRVVLFQDQAETHAIMHLVQTDPNDPNAAQLEPALDSVVNKIIETEFVGVRVDHLHLLLETSTGVAEYPIDFDVTEFARRGNPVTTAGAGQKQAIHVDMENVVGGSVSFFCLPKDRHALSKLIADALA